MACERNTTFTVCSTLDREDSSNFATSKTPSSQNSPYHKTFTGKIAAVIVSGPGDIAVSDTEKSKIVREVASRLQFWTDVAPKSANLRFKLYHYYCPLNAKNRISSRSYPAFHNVLANPAMLLEISWHRCQ